jgi:hypothetical protein
MTTKPPTSDRLAARMAEGSKPGAGERVAMPALGHRLTLDLPDDLYETLREAAYHAGPPTLPMTCLLRAVLRMWAEADPSSAGARRAVELAKAEAAALRARK